MCALGWNPFVIRVFQGITWSAHRCKAVIFGAGRQWRPFGCRTINFLHLLKIWNDSYNNFWRKKVNQIRSRVLETSILFTDTALSSPILYSHYLFSLLVIHWLQTLLIKMCLSEWDERIWIKLPVFTQQIKS